MYLGQWGFRGAGPQDQNYLSGSGESHLWVRGPAADARRFVDLAHQRAVIWWHSFPWASVWLYALEQDSFQNLSNKYKDR